MTISRILREKGAYAPTVAPDALIGDVITQLESEDAGAIVVSTDGQQIEGIISERDVVRGLRQHGPKILDQKVRDLMSSDVITCTAEDRVAGVMAVMDDKKIRHVPVVKQGKLDGIISIRDIVKLRLDEVQSESDAMRSYITGGG